MKSTILRITILVAMMIPTLVNAQSVTSPYQVGTWKDFKQAAVTYTFDDDLANQYLIAVPLFNQYSYTATFYLVTDWSPNWAQFKAAATAGHEIGSHTVTHSSLNSLSLSSQQTELANSQSIINTNIGQKPLTLAYPNCNPSDPTLTSQYYIAARTCSGQINSSSPSDFNSISSIICGNQGSIQTTAQFNSTASSAASSKGWLVYLIHAIDNESGYSPTNSTAISGGLQYLNQNSSTYWVSSFVNVVKYIKERNAATVSVVSDNGSTIVLSVTDNLDNTIYNSPISIRRPLPSGWTGATVTQSGAAVSSSIVTEGTTTYLVFSAVPDKGNVTITSSGNNNIAVTAVTMAPTSATVNAGATTQLTATVSPTNATNKTVSWSSNNTAIATVSSTGLVTGAASGLATITVTTQDGSKTATSAITVNAVNVAVIGVAVNPTAASISIGGTSQLTSTVSPSNATNKNVTWSTSNSAIASVSATGLVTGVASGAATITVTTADGAKTATSAITISTGTISVTGVAVSPTAASISSIGGTSQLTSTVSPSNASNKNVTWSSSNSAIASVSATGLVTGVASGAATITVTTADGAKTATSAITVSTGNIAVTGIVVSPTSVSVNTGATSQLTATVSPSNATNKNVSWSTSNSALATVSSTGLVTGVATGAVTITVTTTDGAKTATCAVTVTTGGTGTCTFGTPTAAALPTANRSYSHAYVLGTGGPNLSNVTTFVINWDLPNKGLWQFSANTNNGQPNWYVDLRTGATQTFASAQPSITLSGTGFAGLDGSYYATIYNTTDLVLVSKTGSFTIYFSNSATAPTCVKNAAVALSTVAEDNSVRLYPNPFANSFSLRISNPESINEIDVVDQTGRVLLQLGSSQISENMQIGNELPSGIYVVKVVSQQNTNSYKIIKK